MSESDEESHLLEDESMDEVYELDDALAESVDTNASPVKSSIQRSHRAANGDQDSESDEESSDSDMSELFNGSSDSEDDSVANEPPELPRYRSRDEPNSFHEEKDGSDDDDDEPPEIPGSPVRTDQGGGRMNRLSDLDISNCGDVTRKRQQSEPTVEILTVNHNSNSDKDSDDDEDYEVREAEAPRAMEFHSSSSSSESESEEHNDDGDNNNHTQDQSRTLRLHNHQQRPKTAAKDLEPYRDLMPKEYYQQLAPDSATPRAEAVEKHTPQAVLVASVNASASAGTSTNIKSVAAPATKYRVRVPQEIEDLFKLVDVFQPDVSELPTRLQPFIPEYVPAIGLPFDGIQIPRPDGRIDDAGVSFVREPGAQSNAAELELLFAAASKKQQARQAERIHSIEYAASRPRDIDQWIASVATVQATKPPPTVIYKKPMPAMASLTELWPEDFEAYLAGQPALAVSELDVTLPELIRIVCGVLDIPVYNGSVVQSLHVLFSLYHEATTYENEMAQQRR